MRIAESALAASASRWVTCTTVIPAAASDSSNATTSARPGPSIIAVASSEMSRRGSRAKQAAIASLCSSPPDSPAVSRSSKPASPTRESTAPTSGRGVGGSPQTTSSRARTPSTWLSGLWKIIDVPPRQTETGIACPAHRAQRRRQAPGYQAHKGRLARAIWADNSKKRPGLDAQRDLRDRPGIAARILVRDLVELDGHRRRIASNDARRSPGADDYTRARPR